MCGIAGIVSLDPNELVEEARLKRMRDVLRHRGPDGEGLWIEGPVGLGHRRLAIVDVAGGHQPMANPAGTAWITYNGEIYNHGELRKTLEAQGHQYRTRSDTETILHLYDEEGDRGVERLRGMFAFGLWDRARRRLLLARDRLGIKPLYYAVTEQEILFASEIKAILVAQDGRPRFNAGVVSEFLATRMVSGEETFFQGVFKLLPGRTLTWSADGGLEQRRYWRLPVALNAEVGSLSTEAHRVRLALTEAVRGHLMSDVPLGVFLSGGIDSTALAALMAPMLSDRLRTFSVGFDEREADELPYARLAAESLGTEHREVVMSAAQFFQLLPRLIWHEDEPIAFPSSVPLYAVSQLARDHVKVVLTGEGADELFLGYNRYRVTAWNERLGRPYGRLTSTTVRAAVREAIGWLPAGAARYAARSFLTLPPGPRSLFCDNFAVFSPVLQETLVSRDRAFPERDPHAIALAHYHEAPGGVLERMSYADLQTYLVELLMKQDQMSMAASIESRVPYLDHVLVEQVASLPGSLKLTGWRTKAVLRAAVRDLIPRPIATRSKMGFPVPLGRWLRGPFWPLVEDLVLGSRAQARGLFDPTALRRLAEEHRTGTAEHGDRLWLLLNLEIWQRLFLDGDDVAVAVAGPDRRALPQES